MKRKVVVNLQFEATHCWPECPIPDVAFLRHPHRHIFFITAKKFVQHNDRDIEIIKLKREIQNFLFKKYPNKDMGRTSCEDLCQILLEQFNLDYCQVLEDNENGAEIEHE